MNSASTTALDASVSGDVVVPGDPDYEQLSKTFLYQGSPAVVVRCRDTDDVRHAIAFAREHGLVVSVRSGGHSGAGFSTNDGGVVIDLSLLNSVEVVSADKGIVRIRPGATWGKVATVLGGHNLAISSGDARSVGVGGLLAGGGIGWMVRKYGLAIDNIVAAEAVTADGQVLPASIDENPDLFWGIRGGGGNLGVVTSVDIAAQPTSGVHFGSISYPATERRQVLKAWARYQRTAPDELTTTVQLFPSFAGADLPPVNIVACFAGSDPDAANAAIEPLLHLGTLLGNEVAPMPYVQALEDPRELPPGWQPWVRSGFAETCTDELIDAAVGNAEKLATLFVQFRALGGAMSRVPADATAFAHRNAEVMMVTVNLGSPDDHQKIATAYHALWDDAAPYVHGASGGFLTEITDADVAAVYPPATFARLADLKARYDPENLFSQNPNVAPSSDT